MLIPHKPMTVLDRNSWVEREHFGLDVRLYIVHFSGSVSQTKRSWRLHQLRLFKLNLRRICEEKIISETPDLKSCTPLRVFEEIINFQTPLTWEDVLPPRRSQLSWTWGDVPPPPPRDIPIPTCPRPEMLLLSSSLVVLYLRYCLSIKVTSCQ